MLAAALRAGIGLPYGCRSGTCGTCKVTLVSGQVDQGAHAERALSADEQACGKALVCCCTAATDLVIEARELTGAGDIPIRKMPCRIARIERPTSDVAIVLLQLPAAERLQLQHQLQCWRPQADAAAAAVPVEIALLPNLGVESEIRRASENHDLVILRSQRRLVAGLPIPASDRTSRLLRQLERSVLVISDPLH